MAEELVKDEQVEKVEDNEQVEETTTQETKPEVDEVQEELNEVVETDKFEFTKEDFDKKIQSISSKAKNEILKELGISTVAEAKAKFEIANGIDEIRFQLDAVTQERNQLADEKQAREDNDLLQAVGIGAEFKDEFLAMLNAVEGDGTRSDKAINLVAKIGKMVGASNVLGNEKKQERPQEEINAIELARLRKL